MSISLPVELDAIAEELDYERGRLIYEGAGGNEVRRSILPGGVRVITEKMPGTRGVSIGFWVGVGSRDEAPRHARLHPLPGAPAVQGHRHPHRPGHRILFDAVGGESNALTAKEHTCYYARVLDDDAPMAVDVITDMVTNALLDPAHLEQERGVILEEIAMDQDDPTDVAFENFVEQLMGDNPLGRPSAVPRRRVTEVAA